MKNSKPCSFTKGYSFSFDVDGNEVVAWFSSISGREKVFVNGALVSSQRSYSSDSINIFRIGPSDYTTTLKVESLLRGPVVCTLKKNGMVLKRKRLLFPRQMSTERRPPGLRRYVLFVLLSVLSGAFWIYFRYSDGFYYGSIAILFVVFFGLGRSKSSNSRNKENCKLVIEEEEIE